MPNARHGSNLRPITEECLQGLADASATEHDAKVITGGMRSLDGRAYRSYGSQAHPAVHVGKSTCEHVCSHTIASPASIQCSVEQGRELQTQIDCGRARDADVGTKAALESTRMARRDGAAREAGRREQETGQEGRQGRKRGKREGSPREGRVHTRGRYEASLRGA